MNSVIFLFLFENYINKLISYAHYFPYCLVQLKIILLSTPSRSKQTATEITLEIVNSMKSLKEKTDRNRVILIIVLANEGHYISSEYLPV